MNVPRNEYPRPQFVRKDWLPLNGVWQFEIDTGDNGMDHGLRDRDLAEQILVPFCPESQLSGIGKTDFLNVVWYRRNVKIPDSWADKRILLHFQAVDYDTTVWVDGVEVARHRGGFTPFSCDLGGVVAAGQNATIVVRARDFTQRAQPGGKQSKLPHNHGCWYTRTTGIWQSVWMEPVPQVYLQRPKITPFVGESTVRLEQPIAGCKTGLTLRAVLYDEEGQVASGSCDAEADFTPSLDLHIPQSRKRLWSPDDPHLYKIRIELLDAHQKVIDEADSYAGLRSVTIDGKAVKINGKVVFQRLVLDQGYWPDGIMTAPSDEALKRDIELALAAGFNGARLHQKVFEERFLYHADRMGYLVWGEFGDWGGSEDPTIITQWLEVLRRDYCHPCIVGWCPLNESAETITDRITVLDDVTRGLFLATKGADGTRAVLDTSGYHHRVGETDVYDCHDYEQDPAQFAAHHASLAAGAPFVNGPADRPCAAAYRGQPFFVSEFGGIWWNPKAPQGQDSWGYGERPKTLEQFYDRFQRLCHTLLDNPNMFAYCYTQLTDVFQEQNGIYYFDRSEKFDITRIRKIQQHPAAIEKA